MLKQYDTLYFSIQDTPSPRRQRHHSTTPSDYVDAGTYIIESANMSEELDRLLHVNQAPPDTRGGITPRDSDLSIENELLHTYWGSVPKHISTF